MRAKRDRVAGPLPALTLREALEIVLGVNADHARALRVPRPTHGTLISIRRRSDGRRRVSARQRLFLEHDELLVVDHDALEAPLPRSWGPVAA